MKRIDVPVHFDGAATVLVPDRLSVADARLLANNLALARVLATTDNPDAPEEDACEDYADECSPTARLTVEADWDSSAVEAVGGRWTTERRK
jgi:hypothetical protein